MKLMALAFSVLIMSGCSFFADRVTAHDERIAALEAELASAPEESKPAIREKIAVEEKAREKALEGVQQESMNRQALLMALISLGAGGLKVAGGMAAKGAGA